MPWTIGLALIGLLLMGTHTQAGYCTTSCRDVCSGWNNSNCHQVCTTRCY